MTAFASPRDRTLDLLADHALVGLGGAEHRELDRLLGEHPDLADDRMELAAAALDLVFLQRSGALSPMPAALRERLRQGAATTAPDRTPAAAPRVAWVAWSGWLVAAAAVVLWVLLRTEPSPTTELDPAQRYEQLLASGTELVRLPWAPLEGGPTGGEVVWDPGRQQGFLRLVGLAPNDPAREQYQLWIFDHAQDDRYPIDGGVFDVEGSPSVIPIDAKIEVRDAWQFVITVERPGGVVVSGRERVAALASGP